MAMHRSKRCSLEEIHRAVQLVAPVHRSTTYRIAAAGGRVKKKSQKRGPRNYFEQYNRRAKLVKAVQKRQIDGQWMEETTAAELTRACKFTVSESAIRRELNRLGYRWRNPKNFRDLSAEQIRARADFAKAHKGKDADWWSRVLFLDEKLFQGRRAAAQRRRDARAHHRGMYRKKGEKVMRPRKGDFVTHTPCRILGGFAGRRVILWKRYRTF